MQRGIERKGRLRITWHMRGQKEAGKGKRGMGAYKRMRQRYKKRRLRKAGG